ncbi:MULTISPECIES: universal stress protein [Oceanimonas]|uniref:Universal stress protein UspA n=1 Tax=Oceanimonas doudoroffii TaxID=84158 RepID=A0A233RDE3_9GAMM|nr:MULTISPECIES: universal stress protein [Oceanimonas]NHH99348.1 Universal stress protein UP12 [Oceanimonas sp. MB9]OXY81405.1 universal stress protein UspA [Oceanimonas doudoroffii]
MYQHIMIPVDLAHVERLHTALQTGADLARLYDATVCYVGVSSNAPSEVAHNPREFERKLQAFATDQAARHQLPKVSSAACISKDPAVDLDRTLLKAVKDSGADLVIMASHVPGLAEHLFASNAGYVANHAEVSVLVVR